MILTSLILRIYETLLDPSEMTGLIAIVIAILFLGLFWGVCRFKYPNYTRIIFCLFYVVEVALIVVAAYT